MPRSIWSGSISFGLVNVPIKLYSAVSKKTVRFHQLHGETGTRIQQRRVDPSTGEEVAYEDIVKGYEIGKDRYVVITPDELESLDPEKTRTIDIEDFVEESEIDPLYYDHPYYLAPATGAEKPYRLLLDAMAQAGRVAIARVVIRNKEQLVAIRPAENVLTMSTMNFADEVVPADTIDEVAAAEEDGGKGKTTKRELDMAEQLIDSLTSEFDPSKYHDTYRERVLNLIERKAAGEEIAVAPEAPEPAPVPDLMAALEASLAEAKGKERPTKRKAPAKKSAKKETSKA
jgi:DNA end-binding protein Ku